MIWSAIHCVSLKSQCSGTNTAAHGHSINHRSVHVDMLLITKRWRRVGNDLPLLHQTIQDSYSQRLSLSRAVLVTRRRHETTAGQSSRLRTSPAAPLYPWPAASEPPALGRQFASMLREA